VNISVFDYGAGNLHSIARALERFPEARVRIAADPRTALDTDLLVLPGVGAFQAAAACLGPARDAMRTALAAGLPCVGVCLGMQLLFESSEEGAGDGLGLAAGRVTRLAARRVPHIGWNTLEPDGDPLFERAPLETAYFANGFACRPERGGEDAAASAGRARTAVRAALRVGAWVTHERDRFPALVRVARTIGLQFHPEKSGLPGVAFLHACMRAVLCA
jgi:glutamine amidotransferase